MVASTPRGGSIHGPDPAVSKFQVPSGKHTTKAIEHGHLVRWFTHGDFP